MINIKKRKIELKKGEKIPLCYDECFKIMFANPNRMEPLTLLLSKILNVEYEELEGNIELYPVTLPNQTIGEKKMERDVVVKIKDGLKGKIILEVNFRKRFYETIINRNLNYLSEVASKGLEESDDYDKIEPTLLVNFNKFYVDNDHKKIFDYYYFKNDEGHILTEKQKILNINIAKCYKDWYNKSYKAQFDKLEKDICLLSAAIYTNKTKEFNECIEKLEAKRKVKNIIEEVSSRMNESEPLKIRYVDFLEETKKINRSIIADEKKKAAKAGLEEGLAKGLTKGLAKGLAKGIKDGQIQKESEIVLNMYKDKVDINLIAKYTNLSVDDVNIIINNKLKK